MAWENLEEELAEEFGHFQVSAKTQLKELGGYLILGGQPDDSTPQRKAYKAAWAKAYRARTGAHKEQYAKHKKKRLDYQRRYDERKRDVRRNLSKLSENPPAS